MRMKAFAKKTSLFRWNAWVLGALLLSFGALTAFEPILHIHELAPTHVEQNCAACNYWSQAHSGVDLPVYDFSVFLPILFYRAAQDIFSLQVFRHSLSNRDPPFLR